MFITLSPYNSHTYSLSLSLHTHKHLFHSLYSSHSHPLTHKLSFFFTHTHTALSLSLSHTHTLHLCVWVTFFPLHRLRHISLRRMIHREIKSDDRIPVGAATSLMKSFFCQNALFCTQSFSFSHSQIYQTYTHKHTHTFNKIFAEAFFMSEILLKKTVVFW
jgi:hypothetical protein